VSLTAVGMGHGCTSERRCSGVLVGDDRNACSTYTCTAYQCVTVHCAAVMYSPPSPGQAPTTAKEATNQPNQKTTEGGGRRGASRGGESESWKCAELEMRRVGTPEW
jgi:hypothetical protein